MSLFKVVSFLVSKYKESSIQVKASFWYAFCNFLQKGISFIIIPVYVRVLTTTEYGQYSVFQSWKEILIIFATLNLYCGVFTKAMVDFEDDRDRYISCMQGLSMILTLVLFVIYILGGEFWKCLFGMDSITIFMMFAYFIFSPAFSFWSVRQRVEYKYLKMVIVTLVGAVLTPVISIVLLFSTNLRANAIIWGFLLVQSIIGLIFYIFQFIKGKTFFVKNYWIRALKFNIPLIPHYLSLIVLAQADRLMIKHYCGNAKVGIYNLAYQISMIMNVVVSAINNTLVPWSYDKLKNKLYSELKEISTKLCIIMCIAVFGIIIIAPEIIMIMGTEQYSEAIWIMPAVAISCYFSFCYNMFSTIEFYYSATKFVTIASVVGAILNIILNKIFIQYYGYIAAGYTTVVCYFVFMLMHYFFMKKICSLEINGESVYNVKFIFISCLMLCIGSGVCMLLYSNRIVRVLIIIIIIFFALIKRREIYNIIKKMK